MAISLRILLGLIMVCAMAFGFFHHLALGEEYLFNRLHIFLFNLVAGCTLVIVYSLGEKNFTKESAAYFAVALGFGACAFYEIYAGAVVLALVLAAIVEKVRQGRFSLFPWDFFSPSAPVSEKFKHAALLCLSIGLMISAVSMVNHEFVHIFDIPKLTLDLFFLGFSFPLSLITFSAMFKRMEPLENPAYRVIQNVIFWVVNLGVITFFVFILAGNNTAEFVTSTVLYFTILLAFWLLTRAGSRDQTMAFFTSGLCFLLFTAVTGLGYIFLTFFTNYEGWPGFGNFMLVTHTFLSLYGWNLSGLSVIFRDEGFPLRIPVKKTIGLHWVTVAVLAPLGYYLAPAAPLAVAGFALFMAAVMAAPSLREACAPLVAHPEPREGEGAYNPR
ncbi:MAG: hypothetical protein ACLFOY_17980 [Desulfatibacillaceae bacterium]